MIDRRDFLARLSGGVLAGGALSTGLAGCEASPSDGATPPILDRLGVQLYTVRDEMAADAAGTLSRIAEMGYREVEFAGLYGHSVPEMRAMLDDVGLRAASSHHGVDAVRGDWEGTLAGAIELGQARIVVPSIPGNQRSRDALLAIAADFNRAGEAAAAQGLRFGYHNHDWEFEPLPDGTLPLDLLLDETDPRYVDWQMDVFWTVQGGGDPIALMDARRGRVTSLHVKDRTAAGEMVDVGDGVIDFVEVIRRAGDQGLLHAFVEHDRPADALVSIRRSFEWLAPRLGMANPNRGADS